MTPFTGSEYEYVRHLVFFGFMCGMTFSALIVVLIHMFTGKEKKHPYE